MYCIKCGAELSDGQTLCPLCGTKVYHPDIPAEDIPTYPRKEFPSEEFNRKGILFVITILAVLPLTLPIIFEFSLNGTVGWSGYVAGAVLLGYLWLILPLWFRAPNPVIFIPCDFTAAALYLLFIDLRTGGNWFLSFAMPITLTLGLIVTTVVALTRYIRRGWLYIFGGGLIALGGWTVLIEVLLRATFPVNLSVVWSLYPLISLFLLGMMLIVIAIVKPLKESLRKIFFIG